MILKISNVKRIQELVLTMFIVGLFGHTLTGLNYYVAVTGSDGNPGTISQPFLTIQKGLTTMSAGDTVWVRGGVYNEQLFWANSGNLGQECVLSNYDEESVIVDGTGLFDLNMLLIANVSHLEVNGLVFENLYIQDANGIFVVGEGENIKIINCEIRNIGWTSDASADPYSVDPSGQAHGILINGRTTVGIKDITINDNIIHDVITGNSEALTLVGNVENFEIYRDTIYNTTNIAIDIAGHYAWAVDSGVHDTLNQSRNGIVKNCIVYENRRFSNFDAPPGLYSDGAKNVTFDGNISYNNGVGMSIGCENPNKESVNVIAINNLIYNNDNEGIYFGSNASGSNIKQCTLKNNTFFENGIIGPWHSEVFLQNGEDCEIIQNIMIAYNSQHHCVGLFSPYVVSNLNVDNNVAYRYNNDASYLYVQGTPSQYSPTNSLNSDPLFVDTNILAPDFSLQNNSPCLNQGFKSYGLLSNKDLLGNERLINGALDLGAIENQTGGCKDSILITSNDLLLGKYIAKQVIQFDLSGASIIEPLELYSPLVNVLSNMQIQSLIEVNPNGCTN